jgi:tetratricopeptide (TPR) repeat protein
LLRTALQLALEQSPYLHLAAPRQPACTAQPGAVQVLGSLDPDGAGWRLELSLQDCASGQIRLRLQRRAPSTAVLLATVDELAASLRQRLGEPLASLSQFDTPLSEGVTTSLPALSAYSDAEAALQAGAFTTARDAFSRALGSDGNCALAYAGRGQAELALQQPEAAQADLVQAFVRRARLSQRRRLRLLALYEENVAGDWLQAETAYRGWRQTYPYDPGPGPRLCRLELKLGQWSDAANDCQGGDRELAQRFVSGNASAGAPPTSAAMQAVHQGRLLSLQASLQHAPLPSAANWLQLGLAQALLGLPGAARSSAARALRLSREESTLAGAALIYGLCRSAHLAEDLDTELEQRFGQGTLARDIELPVNRAWVALSRHQTQAALTLLAPALPYARGLAAAMAPVYVQAVALLAAGRVPEAAAAFQRVLAYPLPNAWSEVSRVGLARAEAAQGQRAAARGDLQQVLAAWQGADSNLPLPRALRRELARLR